MYNVLYFFLTKVQNTTKKLNFCIKIYRFATYVTSNNNDNGCTHEYKGVRYHFRKIGKYAYHNLRQLEKILNPIVTLMAGVQTYEKL
jgi:hypothetical protein